MGAPVPRITLTCQYCGGPFQRMACEMKHKPVRFCSRRCLYASRRNRRALVCPGCGRAFERKVTEIRSEKSYCSRACREADNPPAPTTYPKRKGRHEHRVVAEEKLGRPLAPGEVVHHIDGDKHNNDPSNLQVLQSQAAHTRLHTRGKRQSAEHVRRRVESRRATMESR